VHQSKKENLYS